jgi:glycosyltransferase involved in cell wall biosynthesis
MGKKKLSSKKNITFPFVSICTPTFNRRPFYEMTIKCFQHQTYPMDRMEWVIIDDGTDKIEDLVRDIPQVKYFKYDERMNLGKKRNLMHDKCKGDIIIYMDDDDYYPPERVSHAVETLQKNPQAMVAGSSEMYIYFKHINKMVQFGPYGPNHATAATFAFRR